MLRVLLLTARERQLVVGDTPTHRQCVDRVVLRKIASPTLSDVTGCRFIGPSVLSFADEPADDIMIGCCLTDVVMYCVKYNI